MKIEKDFHSLCQSKNYFISEYQQKNNHIQDKWYLLLKKVHTLYFQMEHSQCIQTIVIPFIIDLIEMSFFFAPLSMQFQNKNGGETITFYWKTFYIVFIGNTREIKANVQIYFANDISNRLKLYSYALFINYMKKHKDIFNLMEMKQQKLNHLIF